MYRREALKVKLLEFGRRLRLSDPHQKISRRDSIKNERQPGLFDYPSSPASGHGPPFPIALLAISKIRGLGVKGINRIVKNYGDSLGDIFLDDIDVTIARLNNESVSSLDTIINTIRSDQQSLISAAEFELEDLSQRNISVLSPTQLPPQLRGRNDSPQWLFVEGNPAALFSPAVAAVGTREPSEDGRKSARMVARILSAYDVTVVSGLADGIDDEIHRATLDRDLRNVAFLGHGINRVFPAATSTTRDRIIYQGGAVVTEYFPNENFQKSFFVQRNRLQALSSILSIFVEAKQKSGTAHTLRFAEKYGKKIVGVRLFDSGIDLTIKEMGQPVVDLRTQEGCRELDKIVNSAVGGMNNRAKVVSKIIRIIESEVKIRHLTPHETNLLASEVYSAVFRAASNSGGNK